MNRNNHVLEALIGLWIVAATTKSFLYCFNYWVNIVFLKVKYEQNISLNKLFLIILELPSGKH